VAESRDVARQAAAAVSITYDELPAITTIEVTLVLADGLTCAVNELVSKKICIQY